MEPIIPVILVLAVGGVLVLGAVRRASHAAQERTAALRALAEQTGWGFREKVPYKTIPSIDRFELFRQGSSRKITNVMTSPDGDVRAVLFDYSYTISSGNSQQTLRQTVYYAVSATLSLPTFSLRPERFYHSIATALGYQDIDIEGRPVFSDMFLLRGQEELRVREVFDEAVCEFLERRDGVCLAGSGHELLYWRPRKLVLPEETETMIADGLDLVQRFGAQ